MTSEKSLMHRMRENSYLAGDSADYIESLYEQFLKDPSAVNSDWRHYFESLANQPGIAAQDISHEDIRRYFLQLAKQRQSSVSLVSGDVSHERKQTQINDLIYAYRALGHYKAKLDPLDLTPSPPVPEITLNAYSLLSESDLDTEFQPEHFGENKPITLRKLIARLNEIYCSSIGAEYMHITAQTEIHWLQQQLESSRQYTFDLEKQKRILACLTAAEGLEKYLGAKYVGQKRFSLEGGESLIPLLDELIQYSGKQDVKEIVIGMAHRGRLNVLVNILGKAPQDLFSEFEGKAINNERSGDVKYHMGFSSDIKTPGGNVHLALAFNPSHLEIVSPVVEGSVRARQQRRGLKNRHQVLPIQIHGDAAFAGQGVVMETFALSQTQGYATGGTIHIIVNNQVGFTTNPSEARSTFYCTDIAKMVQAPIFHVNADDPEAVLQVTQIAVDYRLAFGKDVVIDLICYRRHGHNEADEPAATQPLMYQKIKKHPLVRQIYAELLDKRKDLPLKEADVFVDEYRKALDMGKTILPYIVSATSNEFTVDWTPYLNQSWEMEVNTSVKLNILQKLAQQLHQLPQDMVLQPQVGKVLEDQKKMTSGNLPLNWGYAETMAYATLLNEGYPVRISGQDVGRGTFAHRHAVLHDYNNDRIYLPLQNLSPNQADFSIFNSILSEEAVLGFEYGYATAFPRSLVIWEAQFGDFVNGAQVVIDQFISSGEQKWGRLCGLTMFLPHGFEGMGPEHSSARLERFLQLCAQENMQVCIPSTPAQVFHMIRRQMVRPYRKPLIVMTPKSLLRHKLAVSSLDDLSKGAFQLVISEVDNLDKNTVRRVILCSGKVYYDLLEQRRAQKQNDVAIVRIEQLYPFPQAALVDVLSQYKKAKEIVWCQEEPQNQGAWYTLQPYLQQCVSKGQNLQYVGRDAAASPAVGSGKLHMEQQAKLVVAALGGK